MWGRKEREGIAPKSSCFVGQSRDWTRHRKDVIIGSKWGRTGRISWAGACYSIPPHHNRLFVLKGNCCGIFWDKGVYFFTLVLKKVWVSLGQSLSFVRSSWWKCVTAQLPSFWREAEYENEAQFWTETRHAQPIWPLLNLVSKLE